MAERGWLKNHLSIHLFICLLIIYLWFYYFYNVWQKNSVEILSRMWIFVCFRAINNEHTVVRIYEHIYDHQYDINHISTCIIEYQRIVFILYVKQNLETKRM